MKTSIECFRQATKLIPGGVNSPVRAFAAVGGNPLFIDSAAGAYITDISGNKYVDYVGSWGPMILGHAHPEVIQSVKKAAESGLSFGAATRGEILLAEKIINCMPSIEKLRLVNSGTEANMTAIRLARGFTGKNKIIKFAGCYHGHLDALLVAAGSGNLTFVTPNSAGVPQSAVSDTLIADFNNIASVENLFAQYKEEIAAVIVEPIAGNMNCILPHNNFLQQLRNMCDNHQALLIFDEVMTGFRVAQGGAQELYSVVPDLTVLGKIIGGGMPIGACGGRADIMDCLSPIGDVYQAGTLSGNPIATAAGIATLDLITKPGFYASLAEKTQRLMLGMYDQAKNYNIPLQITAIGGMFGIFFADKAPKNLADVLAMSTDLFARFFNAMLQSGFYFAPSMYEAGFMSIAHSNNIIDETIDAAGCFFKTASQQPELQY